MSKTKPQIQVRELHVAELPKIRHLCEAFWTDAVLAQSWGDKVKAKVFDWDLFIQQTVGMMGAGICTVFALEDDKGQMHGVLVGSAMADYTIGSVIAREHIWFVDRKHRVNALLLLRKFMDWGKGRGADYLCVGSPCNQGAVPRLERLYKKLGFIEWYKLYCKEI